MVMAIFDFLRRWSNTDATNAAKKPPVSPETPGEPRPTIRCSFCGKHQDEVRKIIAGPTVYICDECIDLCNDIIAEECDRDESLSASAPLHQHSDVEQLKCTSCKQLYKKSDLSNPLNDALLCGSCIDGMWKFMEQHWGKKKELEASGGQAPCTICRELYDSDDLFEPVEEPLYCESCLAELKRLAEERKNDQSK